MTPTNRITTPTMDDIYQRDKAIQELYSAFHHYMNAIRPLPNPQDHLKMHPTLDKYQNFMNSFLISR